MGYLWPNEMQGDFLQNYPDQGVKVTMLNLLRYRATADYSRHPDEKPCSGREAYRRYSQLAFPCVEEVGGQLLYSGKTEMSLIGPVDERWDAILLVQYPSLAAFREMSFSKKYRSVAYHRTAALEDSRLIPIFGGRLA